MGGIKDLLGDTPYEPYRGVPPHVQHSTTSADAAVQIEPLVFNLQHEVYQSLKGRSQTDEELTESTNIPPNTLRPRRRELQLKGLIRASAIQRKTKSGRNAVVWEVVS